MPGSITQDSVKLFSLSTEDIISGIEQGEKQKGEILVLAIKLALEQPPETQIYKTIGLPQITQTQL